MRFWLPVLFALSLAGAVEAAEPEQAQPPPPPRPAPDFLFGQPEGSLGIRGSWVFGRAGSDWYDFVTDKLTLKNGDFNGPAIGTDVGITLTNRLDLVIGVDYNQSTTNSEDRAYVDNNRLPIEQQTLLRQANFSGSIKLALTERGRQVGRLAWVPRKVVPFVGGGGGILWYQVRQSGDFVDYVDLSVFTDVFESKGWTPSAQIFGGVDVRIMRSAYVSVDARYLWAAGDLGPTWIDFDPIDLAGLRLSFGFHYVFSEVR
jgi:hypothetical protein